MNSAGAAAKRAALRPKAKLQDSTPVKQTGVHTRVNTDKLDPTPHEKLIVVGLGRGWFSATITGQNSMGQGRRIASIHKGD